MNTNTRKYNVLIAIIFTVLLLLPACIPVPNQTDISDTLPTKTGFRIESNIKWDPVCRHNALYWVSMVGENYKTRIAFGYLGGIAHVQPQVKVGDTWYFFEVKDDKVILKSMDPVYWELSYYMTFIQFATLHDQWIIRESEEREEK